MDSSNSDIERLKRYAGNWVLDQNYPVPTTKSLRSRCQKPRSQNVQNPRARNECVVNPIDGRKRVHKTDEWPNSVHGVVTVQFNQRTSWGTGILIGPNIVLTAGHNLFHYERDDEKTKKGKKIYADLESMRFEPGRNGQHLPFGEVRVEEYFVSPNYINGEEDDYGILILEEPIGEITGYFGLACLRPDDLDGKKISIAGYPEDKLESGPETSYELWKMDGFIEKIDKEQGFISYKIDTGSGQSGSGVVFQEDGKYFVCGIHVKGVKVNGISIENRATLLTDRIYRQIYEWINENVKTKFQLYLRKCEYLIFKDLREEDPEGFSLLLKENLEGLTALDFIGKKIQNGEAILLGQNTSLISLSQLKLFQNNIGDEGAIALAQNTSWINLTYLNLSGNNIGPKGVEVLAKNPAWKNLSKLNLSGNHLGDEGAKELAKNESWTKLEQLYLAMNEIRDEGAKAIGQHKLWKRLSKLNVWRNKIGSEGAKALAENKTWVYLSQLDFSVSKVGPEGATALGLNEKWINLEQLFLDKCDLGAEGAKALAKNSSWGKLLELNLSFNKIGDEGAEALRKNETWNLQKLFLQWNDISDKGAEQLAENTSWKNLFQLNLEGNEITDQGASALAKNANWTKLLQIDLEENKTRPPRERAELNLDWNNMSYEGIQTLSKTIPISNKIPEGYFSFVSVLRKNLNISSSDLPSIWNDLEKSKQFEPLKTSFTDQYRLFILKRPNEFENFVVKIPSDMYFKLDSNLSRLKKEKDSEFTEENDFNPAPSFSIFNENTVSYQICLEEGTASGQSYSNMNLNSNWTAEEVQPSMKNAFPHSS